MVVEINVFEEIVISHGLNLTLFIFLHLLLTTNVILFDNADNAVCFVLATGLFRLSNKNVDISFVAFWIFFL